MSDTESGNQHSAYDRDFVAMPGMQGGAQKSEILLKQELTGVILRLVFTLLFLGSFYLLGRWMEELGEPWQDALAIWITFTSMGTVRFVFLRRRGEAIKSFGPFDEIAEAAVNSADKIRESVNLRPIGYGIAWVGLGGGCAAALHYGVSSVIEAISNTWLFGGFAALIAAFIVLPSAATLVRQFIGGDARRS